MDLVEKIDALAEEIGTDTGRLVWIPDQPTATADGERRELVWDATAGEWTWGADATSWVDVNASGSINTAVKGTFADASAGPITLELPDEPANNFCHTVQKIDGSANPVRVAVPSGAVSTILDDGTYIDINLKSAQISLTYSASAGTYRVT